MSRWALQTLASSLALAQKAILTAPGSGVASVLDIKGLVLRAGPHVLGSALGPKCHSALEALPSLKVKLGGRGMGRQCLAQAWLSWSLKSKA